MSPNLIVIGVLSLATIALLVRGVLAQKRDEDKDRAIASAGLGKIPQL